MKEETGAQKQGWQRTAVSVLLSAAVLALVWPLLKKGTFPLWELTGTLLGLLVLLPLVLRPRKAAKLPELLVHDLLLLLSASTVSLILTEYAVKGMSIGMQKSIWQGLLCYLAVYLMLYLLCGRAHLAVCIGQGIFLVYLLIDHYVMLFRGTPVMLSDVLALRTALSVSGGYSAPVELSVLRVAAAAVLFCACVCLMRRKWRVGRLWTLPVAAVLAVCVFGGLQITGTGIGFWQSSRSYSELFYFLRCAANTVVQKPEGYGADRIGEIAAEYTGEAGVQQPNLIVVMNESFADLRVIEDFETNEDYMPYVRSMAGMENTITGNLLVSTFGGGTANTEFEFLTGDTIGFLPFSSSPYQMYIKQQMPSLASRLAEQGYDTVAMHPYLASSWNRERVYERFGFARQLYEEDFAADAERVRYRISDSEDYRKIYELYENKEPGKPLFMFNVTMQNHGGYEPADYPNYEDRIWLTGEYEGQFPDVDVYLSLLRYSDDAVRELIEYFSAVDEPTAIIFFGDHQPNVDSTFYDTLFGDTDETRTRESKQRKLQTPFFIWANYDIEEEQGVQISDNYLAAYALDKLGCGLSGYDQLRLAAHENVPRINSYGYFTVDGAWHDASTVGDEPALSDYRIMQYAHLFGGKNRPDGFYNAP